MNSRVVRNEPPVMKRRDALVRPNPGVVAQCGGKPSLHLMAVAWQKALCALGNRSAVDGQEERCPSLSWGRASPGYSWGNPSVVEVPVEMSGKAWADR